MSCLIHKNIVAESEYKGLVGLDAERYSLKIKCDSDEREIIQLEFRAENADERVKNVTAFQNKGEELTAQRQKMHFWQIRRKGDIDWEIRKNERKIRNAQRSFEIEHNIAYDEAPAEIERIKKELDLKRSELEKKKIRITEITKTLDDIDAKSRKQTHPIDHEVDPNLVQELLVQMGFRPKKPTPLYVHESDRKFLEEMLVELYKTEMLLNKMDSRRKNRSR